jgi:nitroreductase
MTNAVFVHHARRALRHAAARARLAPSIHNSQPWRFRLEGALLEMELDRERRLGTIDPQGRQALISCGCALFNARAALAAADVACTVQRFPEGMHQPLFARLRAVPGYSAEPERAALADLDAVIDLRATNRTRYAEDDVPQALLDRLAAAAVAEGATLVVVRRPEHRLAVAMLTQRADALQNADPAYRAELRAWTTDDPARLDGVPARAVPHVNGHSGDEIPLRDFDTHGVGRLPAQTASSRRQTILVLGTDGDDPAAWLRAGEAVERVLLEIARRGYAAGPITQALDVPETRDALTAELGLSCYPQFLMRVGRAQPTAPTARRELADVLAEID